MEILTKSFEEFWEILTGVIDDNKAKLVRLSCFTLLFLGMLWAAVNYFRADRISDTSIEFNSPFMGGHHSTTTENRAALNKFEALAKTVGEMRRGGEALASTIIAMNSRPFNIESVDAIGLEALDSENGRDITRLGAIAAMAGNTASLDVDLQEVQQEPQEEVIAPTGILVKAIMTKGKNSTAVVDAGNVKGLVVRRGDDLPNELGKVVRVKSNGITIRTNEHDFDYEVSKIELIKGMR